MRAPKVGTEGWRARYGPWALVAGAAHGLGAAWSHALGRAGLSLLLIDVDSEGLEARLAALREEGVEAQGEVLDLGAPEVGRRVSAAVGGRDLGLVVCNAASSRVGPFLEGALDAHLRVVDVNCRAAVELCHALAPGLVARGRGGLVLLSSLAGFQGTSQVASYAASKAFTLVLGEGLSAELGPRGVDVLVVAPGATRTPAYLATVPQDDGGPLMTPEATVQEALTALGRRPLVVPGLGNRAARLLLGRLLPRRAAVGLLDRAMRRRYPSR